MIWKIRYHTLGGHTHCRLFVAKQPNMTFAMCGEFAIDRDTLDDLQLAMSGVRFEENRATSLLPHGVSEEPTS